MDAATYLKQQEERNKQEKLKRDNILEVANACCSKPTGVKFRWYSVECTYDEYRVRVEYQIQDNKSNQSNTYAHYDVVFYTIVQLDQYNRLKHNNVLRGEVRKLPGESKDDLLLKLRINLIKDMRGFQGEPKAKRITNKAELQSYKFAINDTCTVQDTNDLGKPIKAAILHSNFRRCYCDGIISLTNKLKIKDDLTEYNSDCWFRIKCMVGIVGRTSWFTIIAKEIDDELHYYLLNNTGSGVTDLMERNGVDYSKLTRLDREMVELAISNWLEEHA